MKVLKKKNENFNFLAKTMWTLTKLQLPRIFVKKGNFVCDLLLLLFSKKVLDWNSKTFFSESKIWEVTFVCLSTYLNRDNMFYYFFYNFFFFFLLKTFIYKKKDIRHCELIGFLIIYIHHNHRHSTLTFLINYYFLFCLLLDHSLE